MLNLSGFANVSQFSGMAGIADVIAMGTPVLIGSLVVWIASPLALAASLLARREV